MSSLDSIYISDSYRKITKLGLEKSSARLMPKGSIIMSSRAPIGYIAITDVEACTSQGCKSLIPYITETNKYLLYVIKASINRIIEASKGTTFDEISGKKFGEILIPLAPLNEQFKINNIIDNSYDSAKNIELEYECIRNYVAIAKQKILDEVFGDNSSYKSYYEKTVKFSELFNTISTAGIEIKTRNVLPSGMIPVVSQSQHLIDGYVNFDERSIDNLPVVVFGDHTRKVKYIDFKFYPGADGTKVLKAKKMDDKFFYYCTLYASEAIDNNGYARHFSKLKEVSINLPNLETQRRLANYLDTSFSILNSIL